MKETTKDIYALCECRMVLEVQERGYDIAVILSQRRDLEAVKMRRVIACALRDAGYSLTAIGKALKRDHTSVLNLVNKIYATRKRRLMAEVSREAYRRSK